MELQQCSIMQVSRSECISCLLMVRDFHYISRSEEGMQLAARNLCNFVASLHSRDFIRFDAILFER